LSKPQPNIIRITINTGADQDFRFSSNSDANNAFDLLEELRQNKMSSCAPTTTEKNEKDELLTSNHLSLLRSMSTPIRKGSSEGKKVLAALANFSEIEEKKSTNDEISPSKRRPSLIDEAPKDMKSGWEKLKSSEEPSYSNCALKDIFLPCNLNDFYQKFLANNAKYSFKDYLISIGDSEIKESPWCEELDGFTSSRQIHYRHPVNAPMAPPSAKATKSQRLQRFEEYGICLETCTQVNDVPFTDCFTIEDQILIEHTEKEGLDGVMLQAKFEIRFIKNTFWKRIIEKTSSTEFFNFFNGYADYLKHPLQEGGPQPLLSLQKSNTNESETLVDEQQKLFQRYDITQLNFSMFHIFILFVLILIFLQLLILKRINTFYTSFISMQQQIISLKHDQMVAMQNLKNQMETFVSSDVCPNDTPVF